MTQIIGVITRNYALLASDRRLTIGDGPRIGQIFDDDACKLVNVCNICGIGYTGLATIEGSPTHEWIAKTLASENCDPSRVGGILQNHAARSLSRLRLAIKFRQEFLIVGWGLFRELPGLHSYMRLISNVRDESGRPLREPADSFSNLLKVLVDDAATFCWAIGQDLQQERAKRLQRNMQRLVDREIGPKDALRLLVDEIVNTSLVERNPAVGSKILRFCIPKSSVERQIGTGVSAMVAGQPGDEAVTFTYFDPQFSELRQFGPTFVCGENAYTEIQTESDPSRDFQSSQVRILSLPKPKQ